MKKYIKEKGSANIIIIGIIFVLVIVFGVYLFGNKENNEKIPIVKNEIIGNKDDLVSFSVEAGQSISGIINVEGIVKGGYFFEGNILINLLDKEGKMLKQGYGMAISDWMTAEPVSFTATINTIGLSGPGYIEIKQDDPSDGEGGPARKILIPVIFSNVIEETMVVKLYFPNTKFNPDMLDCSLVYPIEREIAFTPAVATATLNELIKGPTVYEKEQGYFSVLPIETKINSIKIENGILSVDFNKIVESGGGSCNMASKLSSLNNSLKQFETVNEVIISVEGNSNQSQIFQP
jgi:hypothetical protein